MTDAWVSEAIAGGTAAAEPRSHSRVDSALTDAAWDPFPWSESRLSTSPVRHKNNRGFEPA